MAGALAVPSWRIGFLALQTEREPFLEYDLTSIVYRLNQAKKAKLGIMTGLPLAQGSGGVMAQMQGQTQPFVAYAQLMQIFDLTPANGSTFFSPATAAGFTGRARTTSTLQADGDTSLSYFGDGNLYGGGFGSGANEDPSGF